MKNRYILFALLSLVVFSSNAQTQSLCDSLPEFSGRSLMVNDSTLTFWEKAPIKIDKVTASPINKIFFAGGPLVVTGLIVKKRDNDIRYLRDGYAPHFTKHYDDYTQYLPGAIMLGMKIGGVEGRSSWSRMLTADLFSVAIMGTVVNTLKVTTKETRPDGSNNHSFPSGHTATAFMCATMLHEEYGTTRSPWYSVGGYAIATATGIGRMLNNKHWLSDVMVGAGVGIISTELGYFLSDMLFKDKGLLHKEFTPRKIDNLANPSYFGLYVGYNIMPGSYKLSDGKTMTASVGSNVGVEGAWYPCTNWGLGGRLSVANMPFFVNKESQDDQLKFVSAYVGPHFSYPFTSRWLVSTKLLTGVCFLPKTITYTVQGKETVHTSTETVRIGLGTGLALSYFARQNFSLKFFADYNLLPSFMSTKVSVLNVITLGSSVCVMF